MTTTAKLLQGDCLDLLPTIPDQSVDMILADPPYGTTACKWDSIIPLEPMWEQLKRVIKKNGAIVMTASQPFTTTLIASNMDMFKYCWVWEKSHPTGFALSKKRPLKYQEDVCVFYGKQSTYSPQMWNGKPSHGDNNYLKGLNKNSSSQPNLKAVKARKDGVKYPRDIIKVNSHNRADLSHPTQKPVALMEYLIKTYTNEGETVLDFTAGSFTTGVACVNIGRNFIGIEKDKNYFDIGTNRIKETIKCLDLKTELTIITGDSAL